MENFIIHNMTFSELDIYLKLMYIISRKTDVFAYGWCE